MSDIEAQARAQGWKGPDEYKGPPERFKSAEDFLKVAEEIAPVNRERNKYLTDQVERLQAQVIKQNTTLQNLAEHHKRTADLAYKRALRELTKKRNEAVEMGDTDTFRQTEIELQELQSSQPPVTPQADPQPPVHDENIVTQWVSENPWYEDDLILHQAAIMAGNLIARKEPNLSTAEQLEKIKQKVMQSYPDRFRSDNGDDDAPPKKTSPVIGAPNYGGGSGGSKRKKSYSDLPPDAKKACDDFVSQGLMSKDDYVKDYFEME